MVRVTEPERLMVKKRAHSKFLSVSEYIRELLFGEKA
jgi:hypothetical protein